MGLGAIAAGAAGIAGAAYDIINARRTYRDQQAELEYQHKLQKQIFNREDTSLQRRVADAEAAGLNPQLALSGGAGTGQAISTTVPERPQIGTQITDALQSALQMEKQYKELELLNETNEKAKKENALLALREKIEEHDFNYYKDNNWPTNANGQYVQMVQALGSVIEGLKGNHSSVAGSVVDGIAETVQKAADKMFSPLGDVNAIESDYDDWDYDFDYVGNFKNVMKDLRDKTSSKMKDIKDHVREFVERQKAKASKFFKRKR